MAAWGFLRKGDGHMWNALNPVRVGEFMADMRKTG